MFRNLRLYRVFTKWPESEQLLSEMLSEVRFRPCEAFVEKSAGWEPPTGHGELLCRRIHGADLLQLRTQSRVLPAAAVREAVEERADAYRARTGEEPGRRELTRLKQETRDKLLPRALLKSERTQALFLDDEGVLAIDSASPARAEWLLDHLRPALGRLQCVPLAFGEPPGTLLTRLFLGNPVARFEVGRECRMQDPSDSRAIASWRDIDLDDPTIRRHVSDGMRLTHLAVVYDQIMSCVIGEDGVIGKLRCADGGGAEEADDEDPQARQDADFVLLCGMLRRLLTDLKKHLGGYSDARPAPPGTAAGAMGPD